MWIWVLFFAPRDGVNRFEDREWAAWAEQICAEAANQRLELADYTRLDSGGSALIQQRADLIDRATATLESMLAELRAQPPADAKGRAIVPMWLDEYDTYVSDRRQYTSELRASGENLPFYETLNQVPISERLATFAADNEMPSCKPPFDLDI